jgi:succinate dehydrogenase / fumarate reductase flavoprotein subunit
VGNYLGQQGVASAGSVSTDDPAFAEVEAEVRGRIESLLSIGGTQSPRSFHKRLGHIIWEYCGMARSESGLKEAIAKIGDLRTEFWSDLRVTGGADGLNPELERAGRVADFIEFGGLMCRDALMREESCGGHFRVEHQTEEGEALRDDVNFTFSGVWEYLGDEAEPQLHKEPLVYENVELATRSYK